MPLCAVIFADLRHTKVQAYALCSAHFISAIGGARPRFVTQVAVCLSFLQAADYEAKILQCLGWRLFIWGPEAAKGRAKQRPL